MKKLLSILLVAIMVFGIVACGGNKDTKESAAGKETAAEKETDAKTEEKTEEAKPAESGDEKITIGYACKDINDTFQNYLIEAAQKYCDENNIKLEVNDAQNDVVTQQDQVNNFITKGVDAIIVLPIDSTACEPMTKAAVDAGIPLVYANTLPCPADKVEELPEGVYYVGSNEIEAGQMQAEFVAEKVGDGAKATILIGTLGHEGAFLRTQGAREKFLELVKDGKVLAEQNADWQKDQALTVTENWLTTYDNDIDAIFANNDEMALGAVNALEAAGLTDVLVCGVDGTKDGVAAVKDGKLACSIFQDAKGQGAGAAEIAATAVREGKAPEKVVWVPFQLITKENADQFNQ